jgi:NTP pyrophosphatase (non-canonical NTP hydrolase)
MSQEPNPWHPITDPVDLKHLGKLGEEASELGAAVSRCIIQGLMEREPETGKLNAVWLQEEIADVLANIELVITHFELHEPTIIERAQRKARMLRKWHAMS